MLRIRAANLKCKRHPCYNGTLPNFHASCASCEAIYRTRLVLVDAARTLGKNESDLIRVVSRRRELADAPAEQTAPLFGENNAGYNPH